MAAIAIRKTDNFIDLFIGDSLRDGGAAQTRFCEVGSGTQGRLDRRCHGTEALRHHNIRKPASMATYARSVNGTFMRVSQYVTISYRKACPGSAEIRREGDDHWIPAAGSNEDPTAVKLEL